MSVGRLRIIRFIIAWCPLLLVGLWGISYLRAVLLTTLAPGLPFSIILHTDGGNLTLKGESFSLSLGRGVYLFNQLKLYDPLDQLMASAQQVQVRGPGLLHITAGPFHIKLTNGFAHIVRSKNGQFLFQKYLPPPKQTPSEIATDFEANSIQFLYSDETGSKSFQQSGAVTNVHFSSFEGAYLGSGLAQLTGLGQTQLLISTQERQPIDFQAKEASLTLSSIPPPLVVLLKKLNPTLLTSLGFKKATLTGDINGSVSPAGKLTSQATFSIQASDAKWRQYRAPKFSFNGEWATGPKDQIWGNVTASTPRSDAQSTVTIDWTGPVQVSGDFRATSNSLNQLLADAAQKSISNISVQKLVARGTFNYNRARGFSLSTQSSAGQAVYEGEKVSHVQVTATILHQFVRFHAIGDSASVGHIDGNGSYAIAPHELNLVVDSFNSRLEKLVTLLPQSVQKQITAQGPVNAQLNVYGALANLKANFRAQAAGEFHADQLSEPISIQGFALVGNYAKGVANLNRLWLKTNSGTAWGEGTVDTHSLALRASIDGRAFPLGLANPDLSGLGSLSGTVTGTLKQPSLNGIIEVYDGGYQGNSVTLAHGEVTADLHHVQLNNLEALRRASLLKGNLGLDLKTKGLSGDISGANLHLGDFIGDQFLGNFSASLTHIGGTLDDPTATLTASGSNLIANTVPMSKAELTANLSHHELNLDSATIDLNPGLMTATGHYDLNSRKGTGVVNGKALDFGKLVAEAFPTQDYHVDGTTDGKIHFSFTDHGLQTADGTGTVDAVAINKAPLGDGPWNFTFGHDSLTGNLQISHKATFLSLENAKFDHVSSEKEGTISGAILANNISLADLQTALQPLVSRLPISAQRNLFGVDGQLQTEIDFDGSPRNLDELTISIPTLTASDMKRSETSFGSISAKGALKKGIYSVTDGSYADGTATGSFEVTLDPGKSIAADAELDGFDLSKLLTFFPQSPALNGTANISLIAKGDPSDPDIRASALARNISYGSRNTVFGLNLDDIQAHQGLLTASGDLTYNGFVGKLTGSIPYLETPQTAGTKLQASLILDQRPISDFQPYIPELASRLGTGTFNGFVKLQGSGPENVLSNLHLNGQLIVQGQGLALQVPRSLFEPNAKQFLPLNTGLSHYNLSLFLDNNQLRTTLEGQSSEGGTITGVASSDLIGVDEALADFSNTKRINLLESPLTGKLTIDNFAIKENSADLTTAGRLNGTVALGGTMKNPKISGDLTASNLTTAIPSFNSTPSVASTPLIDPTFDINMAINGVATIKTALASIGMRGTGKLAGSLSNPNFHADLSVASGRFRLPGGEVRLQPGGTVTGSYADNGFGTSTAQLLVDIYGNTHLTAAPTPDQIQRYDVSLEIRGDLLDPNNVQILASSDPPDLSQTEILNLLGRTDILSALNGGTGSKSGALQNALTGFALPSLLEPLTSNLSKTLGLDYLSLEYDAFGQTSLLLGKRLGGGFSISIQRQISAPLPGFPLYYDYRLNYHPAFLGQRFRSFNFLLGTDQQNLWKIGFQYSTRF